MKRLFVFVVSFMLAVTLVSCGGEDSDTSSKAESLVVDSVEIQLETDEDSAKANETSNQQYGQIIEVSSADEEGLSVDSKEQIEESEVSEDISCYESSMAEEASQEEEISNILETSEKIEESSEEISEEAEQSLSAESESAPTEEPVISEPPEVEDTTSVPPAEKEPETIPNLLLWPQPEGEHHILKVGESLQLYSQIEGSVLEDAMLSWKVSDPTVIGFSAKKVTALSPGIATVTLSYSNGLKPVSVSFMVIASEEGKDTNAS